MHVNEGRWIFGPLQYNRMWKREKEGKKKGSAVKTVKMRFVAPDNNFSFF